MLGNVLSIGSLVALFIVILFFGWTVKKHISIKKELGGLVTEISPNKENRRITMVALIVFVLVVVAATIIYGTKGISFNYANVLLFVLVLFTTASYIKRITQIHEKGILAYGQIIRFNEIKKHAYEKRGKKILLILSFRDGTEFKTFIAQKDEEKIKTALNSRVK